MTSLKIKYDEMMNPVLATCGGWEDQELTMRSTTRSLKISGSLPNNSNSCTIPKKEG